MVIARLPLILLVFYSLKVFAHGQKLSPSSATKPNTSLSNLIATDPRIGELISKAKSQKQSASQDGKSANKGTTNNILSQKNKLPQNRIGLQEFLNLRQQQQGLTVPLNAQPLSMITQAPPTSQDKQPPPLIQQQLANPPQASNTNSYTTSNLKQQAINSHSVNQQSNTNFQSAKEFTKTFQNFPGLALQQNSVQPVLSNNFHSTPQQTLKPEFPLVSSLAVNGQVQGLPSQVSQGVLLSNLGLSSSLPSILTNPCSKPSTNQVHFIVSQNDATSQCEVPFSVFDSSKNLQAFSISPSSFPSESLSNTQCNSNSIFIPLNSQNSVTSQSNIPMDFVFDGAKSIQFQEMNNPIDIQSLQAHIQTPQTIQLQQFSQPQYMQSQPSQSLITDPHPVPQSSPQSIYAQPIPLQPSTAVQAQSAQVPSIPTSQNLLQSSNFALPPSPQYSLSPLMYSPKQSTKSTMKALLPLLFNLLKDKNSGCGCSPNCNCGCMSNFGIMQEPQYMHPFINNNDNNSFDKSMEFDPDDDAEEEDDERNSNICVDDDHPEPQVTDGYANQIKYGLPVEKKESQNLIDSIEVVTPSTKNVNEKKNTVKDYQYQNYKKNKNESIEYEEDYEDDSYEIED